jgi:hypothetical protein
MVVQKLNYVHQNPLQEHWRLVEVPQAYAHSSAAQATTPCPSPLPITTWGEVMRCA